MRYIKLATAALFLIAACLGCSGGKPAGIPSLSKVQVTVVKSGTPVKDANVFLVPAVGTASGSWSVSGKTDVQGLAVINTSQGDWSGIGAPEGEYKIYLTKFAQIEEPEMPANMDEDEEAKAAYYAEREKRLKEAGNEIPASMNDAERSGLKVSVAGPLTELTIDVDEAK